MCTSLTLPTPDGRQLFGRTLDLDTHFGERVALTPRRYPFRFGNMPALARHHALLGMAAVAEGYPLYAEAMNERGLCMAGLRFSGNAVYADRPVAGKVNLAPWELIPYLLGKYATVGEVRNALREVQLIDTPFRADLPAAPLHWHIADSDPAHGSIVVESTAAGMRIYDNASVGVLTNNPPFPYQLAHYAEFTHLSNHPRRGGQELAAELSARIEANLFSLGDGAFGFPGDYSSPSRFIRAATLRRWVIGWMEAQRTGGEGKEHSIEVTPVAQFFRILAAVSPMAGAVMTDGGGCHRTLYTCCMDGAAGVYHYFTEEDTAVRAVSFAGVDLEGETVL